MPRILLIDDSEVIRKVVAAQLTARGFEVELAPEATTGAELAFASPPDAVVTDLWMPGISGLQLCRLLRADPRTAKLPVILITASADMRSRFWARCAGATAYISKAEIANLAPLLNEAIESAPRGPELPGPGPTTHVQERLSQLLDSALYEATVAGEIRSLAHVAEDPSTLFDGLTKLASAVVGYRWLALATTSGQPFLHAHADTLRDAEREAREALSYEGRSFNAVVADAPIYERGVHAPRVHPIQFGQLQLGTLALCPTPRGVSRDDEATIALLASELAGPLRIATLVAEARRLAATDSLTGLMNRRAFLEAMERERSRSARHVLPLSLLMVDIDHFKRVNDRYGHEAGDCVLRSVAAVMMKHARRSDIVARWGGEEFIVALTQTAEAGGRVAAERLRLAIKDAAYRLPSGEIIPVTASIGVAYAKDNFILEELFARADKGLYAAKAAGRNRVGDALLTGEPPARAQVSVPPSP
jgi:two-component system cell cycle response regulator